MFNTSSQILFVLFMSCVFCSQFGDGAKTVETNYSVYNGDDRENRDHNRNNMDLIEKPISEVQFFSSRSTSQTSTEDYLRYFQEQLNNFKGPSGEKGLEGIPGAPGKPGYCPAVQCHPHAFVPINGIAGPVGACIPNCRVVPGPRGSKGEKGNDGWVSEVVLPSLERLTYNAVDNWVSKILAENKSFQNDQEKNHMAKKRRRRSLDYSPQESALPSEQKPLGVIILEERDMLMSQGRQLPIGSIVATYLEECSNCKLTGNAPMGMFVKTDELHNRWNRVPVKFGEEITYDGPPIHSPASAILSHQLRKPSRPQFQLVLAFHPVAVTGGQFRGWYGADTMCHNAGIERMGLPGFRVFLADRSLPIDHILPWRFHQIPVVNLAGATLFRSYKEFIYGMSPISDAPIYDLEGMPLSKAGHYFWFGTGRDYSCDYWASNSRKKWGLLWTIDTRRKAIRTSYSPCDNPNYLLCYKLMPKTAE